MLGEIYIYTNIDVILDTLKRADISVSPEEEAVIRQIDILPRKQLTSDALKSVEGVWDEPAFDIRVARYRACRVLAQPAEGHYCGVGPWPTYQLREWATSQDPTCSGCTKLFIGFSIVAQFHVLGAVLSQRSKELSAEAIVKLRLKNDANDTLRGHIWIGTASATVSAFLVYTLQAPAAQKSAYAHVYDYMSYAIGGGGIVMVLPVVVMGTRPILEFIGRGVRYITNVYGALFTAMTNTKTSTKRETLVIEQMLLRPPPTTSTVDGGELSIVDAGGLSVADTGAVSLYPRRLPDILPIERQGPPDDDDD